MHSPIKVPFSDGAYFGYWLGYEVTLDELLHQDGSITPVRHVFKTTEVGLRNIAPGLRVRVDVVNGMAQISETTQAQITIPPGISIAKPSITFLAAIGIGAGTGTYYLNRNYFHGNAASNIISFLGISILLFGIGKLVKKNEVLDSILFNYSPKEIHENYQLPEEPPAVDAGGCRQTPKGTICDGKKYVNFWKLWRQWMLK